MNHFKPFAGVGVLLFAVLVVAHAQWANQESQFTSSRDEEALPPFDLPLVSPMAVPDGGTFWSAQHAGEWPPLPFNPVADFGVPVYSMGYGNWYLIDDRLIDYPALEAELAAAKLLTRMSMNSLEFPGEGEEGEGGEGGDWEYTPILYGSNDLWLEVISGSVTNGMAELVIHNPEDLITNSPVWDLFATTNLNVQSPSLNGTNWTWLLRTDPGQTNVTAPALSDFECYYRITDTNDTDGDGLTDAFETLVSHSSALTNDTDGDGLLDGWEWVHFGSFDPTDADDFDDDGTNNVTEQANATNPNDIIFRSRFPSFFVNQTSVYGTFDVASGVPFEMAVLVNNTNLASAQWLPYTSNFMATLGSTDGVYTVRVALRGRSDEFPPVWDDTEIILDRVVPTLTLTHPVFTNTTVIKPYLQLQGLTDEPLSDLSYNLSNAFGLVTNVPASVIEQEFDTNTFDFTTNWFQAYDVPLAANLNHLLLTVTDRAGNATSTNLFITLDYTGATNPPVTQLLWPTNGSSIAGDTMTVRGQINDETAQVSVRWVAAGVTNIQPGTVERNGLFWIQKLPLDAGTNALTLAAVDAAGNVSESSFTAIRGSLTVNVTSSPEGDQLYEGQGYVGGTVSDFNAVVTVNGVTTTNDGYGNWSAANVPLNGSGVAAFEVSATPASGPTEHLNFAKVMPAAIRVVKHYVKQTVSSPFADHTWIKSYRAWDEPGSDGLTRHRYQGTASDYWSDSIDGPSLREYAWSDTNAMGTYHTVMTGWEDSGPMTEYHWLVRKVPDEQLDHTEGASAVYVQHFYARGVRHEWPGLFGPTIETLEARTSLRYYAPGPAETGRDKLRWISVNAWAYRKPQSPEWYYTPADPVPGGTVLVNGRPLGLDGREWQVAASGSSQDLHLKLGDAKHAGLNQEHGMGDLISLTVVSNAAQVDGTNWAAVKATNEFVYVEATLSEASTNAARNIAWSGGVEVPGNPFQRKVSKSDSVKTHITATLGTNTLGLNVWVVWATVNIKIHGTLDPDNHAALLDNGSWPIPGSTNYNFGLGGGNSLGTIDCLVNSNLNYAFAVGKMEAKAVLQPSGVGMVITNGWSFYRYKEAVNWDNSFYPPESFPPGSDDVSPEIAKYSILTNGILFDLDAPGCSARLTNTNINHTSECYFNFTQFVVVMLGDGPIICSDLTPWSYQARVDVDNPTNKVLLNLLSTNHITIPTNAYFQPR